MKQNEIQMNCITSLLQNLLWFRDWALVFDRNFVSCSLWSNVDAIRTLKRRHSQQHLSSYTFQSHRAAQRAPVGRDFRLSNNPVFYRPSCLSCCHLFFLVRKLRISNRSLKEAQVPWRKMIFRLCKNTIWKKTKKLQNLREKTRKHRLFHWLYN